jgi:hypothetical protein
MHVTGNSECIISAPTSPNKDSLNLFFSYAFGSPFCLLYLSIHFFFLVRALIQSSGVKGEVTLSQRSPFDPTWIRMNLTSANDRHTGKVTKTSAYKIHELPPLSLPSVNVNENHCLKTGSVFNPGNIQEDQGM